MTLKFVTDYLDEKIAKNQEFISCSVYDLRVNHNFSEQDVDVFLQYAKTRLENLNYQVYFTGAKYNYDGEQMVVESNNYMIAIKEKEGAENGE